VQEAHSMDMFYQGACGVCLIDYKDASLGFTGFAGLHLICPPDLKGKNAYLGTCQEGILFICLYFCRQMDLKLNLLNIKRHDFTC